MATNIIADNQPDPNSVTTKLSEWVSKVSFDEIPEHIRERSKYLILDGLGCAFVGAHLPWSEEAVESITKFETPGGHAPLIGWKGRKTGLLAAALINSTFIQGFELDDYHSYAPLHSNSIILPALLSILSNDPRSFTGKDFLLATIVGYEVGPRVGRSIGGSSILSVGWHSGAVFGPPAASASVSKLLQLNSRQVEDAFGMACTQAAGLMSAQFESSVKRMQHGFAARNGLFAALMAESNYKGISKVFERKYGGYIPVFTLGGLEAKPEEICSELGETWRTEGVLVKKYACMGGIHSTCEAVETLLDKHSINYENIKKVTIELTEAPFHHGGWKAAKPIQVIGAQMNNAYIAATIFIDGSLRIKAFDDNKLNRDEIWNLVDKTECKLNNFEGEINPQFKLCTQVTVLMDNGDKFTERVINPKGVLTPFSGEEIVNKFKTLTTGIISADQQEKLIEAVLDLENVDIEQFLKLLDIDAKSPFEV